MQLISKGNIQLATVEKTGTQYLSWALNASTLFNILILEIKDEMTICDVRGVTRSES